MNPIVEKLRKLRSEMPWTSSEDAHAQMERNRQIVAQASAPAATPKHGPTAQTHEAGSNLISVKVG